MLFSTVASYQTLMVVFLGFGAYLSRISGLVLDIDKQSNCFFHTLPFLFLLHLPKWHQKVKSDLIIKLYEKVKNQVWSYMPSLAFGKFCCFFANLCIPSAAQYFPSVAQQDAVAHLLVSTCKSFLMSCCVSNFLSLLTCQVISC